MLFLDFFLHLVQESFYLLKTGLSLIGRFLEMLLHFLCHSFHFLTAENFQLRGCVFAESAGKLLSNLVLQVLRVYFSRWLMISFLGWLQVC